MALTPNLLSASSLALAFVASASGSLHCAGMCGPLRLMLHPGPGSAVSYHLGRLAAYLFLGALMGSLGWALPLWLLLAIAALGISANLISWKLPAWAQKARSQMLLLASGRPALLGLASGILPCGMLHGWLAAAVATRSTAWGAGLLLMLWLGTVPAVEGASILLRGPMGRMRKTYPKAIPALLLLLAVTPLGLRLGVHLASPPEAKGSAHSCHH